MSKKNKNYPKKPRWKLLHQYYSYTGFYSFIGELQGTWEDLGDGEFLLIIDGDAENAQIRTSGNRIFVTLEDAFWGGTIEYRGNKI